MIETVALQDGNISIIVFEDIVAGFSLNRS
jgi:hypothetical protein